MMRLWDWLEEYWLVVLMGAFIVIALAIAVSSDQGPTKRAALQDISDTLKRIERLLEPKGDPTFAEMMEATDPK